MTIPKKSAWPFHSFLVKLAAEIEKVPEEHRKAAAAKTVERCVRLGVKLAVHFGLSPALVLDQALSQLRSEGGQPYAETIVGAFDAYAAKRVEEFKSSEAFVAHKALEQHLTGITGKGGQA